MVISISKIKKISLIMKNWILNGMWPLEIGSNPHSKGDDFSRLNFFFFEIKKLIKIRKMEITKNNKIKKIKFKINYIS